MSSESRRIHWNWNRGQKVLCVSLEDEFTDYTRQEMRIGEIYQYSAYEGFYLDKTEAISFSGKSYIHPAKNFISLPDEIDLKKETRKC